ncbi:PAS domain-containing protein [Aerosakkonema funiforme]|uniref:PAS domain-containing protein n=1 Tax=Aerosakkonema funiforme FACHB-1375 TaxID=2949571 RepID=A0A926ZHE7_9CYAN|nr:PAS domain-containing protein [Aerosakkonema funiforme]MBD2182544.1 PAS domain-containing protein [Aerosakkonema funiforme FACHB-1375]
MEKSDKTLWELLWQYDPNGLIVVDKDMNIKLVNPGFCKMFNVLQENIIGKPASTLLKDVSDFQKAWDKNIVIRVTEKEYKKQNLYVTKVIFPIPDQNIIACIMVDITHERQRQKEMVKLRKETVVKVNEVVDNQMKVAQEIAGLLGETTAETKVSLLKIIKMLEHEIGEEEDDG